MRAHVGIRRHEHRQIVAREAERRRCAHRREFRRGQRRVCERTGEIHAEVTRTRAHVERCARAKSAGREIRLQVLRLRRFGMRSETHLADLQRNRDGCALRALGFGRLLRRSGREVADLRGAHLQTVKIETMRRRCIGRHGVGALVILNRGHVELRAQIARSRRAAGWAAQTTDRKDRDWARAVAMRPF